ncbi:hypothetical protein E4U22_002814 [Claviceps purpurea]|uniref:Peptidase S1 domain-containing protein n=1 Tax=Claviceps purpurea (strain 20.1) TaxID=1111077 RepID=M1WEY5_CLAP2|nr:hypothetical protein E4U37_006031 [Claviceps purpurea]CCE30459.1 uncharacterized protein CPUR_04307 [Claviceps purpurea 20.1]KAG6182530.1 hypothetical protein E4U36_003265 [Claviceps purpurea]KAG6184921.1 hypothetical protein E4U27_000770 [Claviceps purpurea]KAG6196874.1 hypothetical protein E4U10_000587 [Claviceps purpurea]
MLSPASLLSVAALLGAARAEAVFYDGIPTVGVLYDDNLSKHYCTASVVDSKQGNIIITAAHCLSTDGTEINFAPGYNNGATPYGTYPVLATYINPKWNSKYDETVDFAFMMLGKGMFNGTMVNVQEATGGGNRLVINAGYEQNVEIVGYAYGEQRARHCSSMTYEAKRGQMGIECGPLQSGTSGAPWIANYNPTTRRGDVIGDIGGWHTGGCDDYETFSPKFSQATKTLYNRAVRGGSGDDVEGGAPENCGAAFNKKIGKTRVGFPKVLGLPKVIKGI